jgi:putative ABC transport system permease protein
MGASVLQVVRLMIWKFSQPVVWALLVSLPGAYLASRTYTGFFADRLSVTGIVVAFAGVLAVGLSWAVVAAHAIKIAKMNPIGALRHE